jgi:hypothetical protein
MLQKGFHVAVSGQGAAAAGWQTENLVTLVDDFYVYPTGLLAELAAPLVEAVEKQPANWPAKRSSFSSSRRRLRRPFPSFSIKATCRGNWTACTPTGRRWRESGPATSRC